MGKNIANIHRIHFASFHKHFQWDFSLRSLCFHSVFFPFFSVDIFPFSTNAICLFWILCRYVVVVVNFRCFFFCFNDFIPRRFLVWQSGSVGRPLPEFSHTPKEKRQILLKLKRLFRMKNEQKRCLHFSLFFSGLFYAVSQSVTSGRKCCAWLPHLLSHLRFQLLSTHYFSFFSIISFFLALAFLFSSVLAHFQLTTLQSSFPLLFFSVKWTRIAPSSEQNFGFLFFLSKIEKKNTNKNEKKKTKRE